MHMRRAAATRSVACALRADRVRAPSPVARAHRATHRLAAQHAAAAADVGSDTRQLSAPTAPVASARSRSARQWATDDLRSASAATGVQRSIACCWQTRSYPAIAVAAPLGAIVAGVVRLSQKALTSGGRLFFDTTPECALADATHSVTVVDELDYPFTDNCNDVRRFTRC